MIVRNHHSYLVRCRDLGTIGQRIEIEHIQSGSRTVVGSLEAALVWLQADPDERVSTSAVATQTRPEDGCPVLDQ